MVSKKTISGALAHWGLQDESITDIVFPETGSVSDMSGCEGEEL